MNAITRPNGSIYRPRKIRVQQLGNEDETTGVVVLGTHDIADARTRAAATLVDACAGWGFALLIDPRDRGKRVWYRQTLGGWYEDSPVYLFTADEERGAAGVKFEVLTSYDLDDLALDEFDLPIVPNASTPRAMDFSLPAVPDATDIAEHLDTCEGCADCAERAWCEPCQADTIPIRGCCHECNQPVGRSTAPDRIQEH